MGPLRAVASWDPHGPRLHVARAMFWGSGVFLVASAVMLPSYWLGVVRFEGLPSPPRPGPSDWFGTVLLAPALETLILIWLIAGVFGRCSPVWRIVLPSVLLGVTHIPFKTSAVFVVPVTIAFMLDSGYIARRLDSASRRTCTIEAFLMHAWYNALAMTMATAI